MKPCKHRGEEIGYIGCSCQSVEPVYICNMKDIPCAHRRPEPGNYVLSKFDGAKEWFTGHNPTCNTCQLYEMQANNLGTEPINEE